MDFILNRYRNLTILLVVIAAQLLLLAYQVKSNQDVRLIRVWAVTAVTPIAHVLEIVRRNTIGVVEDYFVLIHVRDENRRLNDQLGKLKMENQFLRSELQTADRVKALEGFQSRTPSKTLVARIIGNAGGTTGKVVYVDRGIGNGIERGMAVVTPDGIVGKVLDVFLTASQVQLITDPNFGAGVISDKNRVHGTVKGRGHSKCIVDYVQNEEKLEQGEMFYTSGEDGVFPKGLPVGRATVVKPGRDLKDIVLVPAGFQNGLEEVLIVLEGVHQALPKQDAVPQQGVHVQGPPPEISSTTPESAEKNPVLKTDADRLREKYKKIGEAQNHTFGEGLPGSRPPDFNANPEAAKPPAPVVRPPAAALSSAPAASGASTAPKPAVTVPATSPAGSTGPTGSPVAAPAVRPPAASGSSAPSSEGTAAQPRSAPPARVQPSGQAPQTTGATSAPKPSASGAVPPATGAAKPRPPQTQAPKTPAQAPAERPPQNQPAVSPAP